MLLRKDVDLVFIICQPDLHAQIAVKALGIGKHVLCDRPAGLCQVKFFICIYNPIKLCAQLMQHSCEFSSSSCGHSFVPLKI